eukprot:COSAG02_NODE_14571_length_1258_cov_20.062123_1_plen_307_part_00
MKRADAAAAAKEGGAQQGMEERRKRPRRQPLLHERRTHPPVAKQDGATYDEHLETIGARHHAVREDLEEEKRRQKAIADQQLLMLQAQAGGAQVAIDARAQGAQVAIGAWAQGAQAAIEARAQGAQAAIEAQAQGAQADIAIAAQVVQHTRDNIYDVIDNEVEGLYDGLWETKSGLDRLERDQRATQKEVVSLTSRLVVVEGEQDRVRKALAPPLGESRARRPMWLLHPPSEPEHQPEALEIEDVPQQREPGQPQQPEPQWEPDKPQQEWSTLKGPKVEGKLTTEECEWLRAERAKNESYGSRNFP